MSTVSLTLVIASCWSLTNELRWSEAIETRNLIGKLAPADLNASSCSLVNELDPQSEYLQKSNTRIIRGTFRDAASKNSPLTIRSSQKDADERRERIDESMARFMQLLTLFGHVDNYLTQKASSLMKIMGRAVESEEEEVRYPYSRGGYRRSVRKHRAQPRISTTITS